jgi:hypothetical protein
MASAPRTWPIVLFLGLCVSLLVGSAVAVAAPSDGGAPWWHDGDPQVVTGHVVEVDRVEGTVVLDELVGYDDERAIATTGTMRVAVADLGELRPDETVDVRVHRHDGTWVADELTVLDTD